MCEQTKGYPTIEDSNGLLSPVCVTYVLATQEQILLNVLALDFPCTYIRLSILFIHIYMYALYIRNLYASNQGRRHQAFTSV